MLSFNTSKNYSVIFRLLLLAAAILLVSCGTEPEPEPAHEPELELEPELESALFNVVTDDGMFVSSDYKGKVIYLDFWASWCGPCRESFPWMNQMRAKYGDNLEVIAVSLDQDKNQARRFAEEFEAEFTIGFDVDGTVADQFGVRGLPSSVIINRDGNLVESHTGFNPTQAVEFEASLAKVIEGS